MSGVAAMLIALFDSTDTLAVCSGFTAQTNPPGLSSDSIHHFAPSTVRESSVAST